VLPALYTRNLAGQTIRTIAAIGSDRGVFTDSGQVTIANKNFLKPYRRALASYSTQGRRRHDSPTLIGDRFMLVASAYLRLEC
jgi:hypothetical protein